MISKNKPEKKHTNLAAEVLYHHCDDQQLAFDDTTQLDFLEEMLGQKRAMEAAKFGMEMKRKGFNLFVLGPSGVGKHSAITQYLQEEIKKTNACHDWCYVDNFETTDCPKLLKLPAGVGTQLQESMLHVVEELQDTLFKVFDSEEYHLKSQEIEDDIKQSRDSEINQLSEEAEKLDIRLLKSPGGFTLAPIRDGKVVVQSEFARFTETDKQRYEESSSSLEQKLSLLARKDHKWQREFRNQIKSLNKETASHAISHLFEELTEKYKSYTQVIHYFGSVQDNIIDSIDDILRIERSRDGVNSSREMHSELRKYYINLLVDNRNQANVPLIYEDNPSYQNLVGKIEHIPYMGSLVTDFTLIKAGALHRANGGYLLLDAYKLLSQPQAWEGLKRALCSEKVTIQSLGEALSIISTASLDPEPMPLDVKIILIGDRYLYYLLQSYDPEFTELFKVAVDFEESIERSAENTLLYARLIATLIHKEKLLAFDKFAVCRVIEHGSRLVEDTQKLSTHMRSVVDLLMESEYWALQENRSLVCRHDVQRAIEERIHRADRYRSDLYKEIKSGVILIEVSGSHVGCVNALSVIDLQNFAFAQPSRVTATAHVGNGDVVDIEREIDMGGPIHSKGVLIISAFLASRFAQKKPLSMSASLVFEQSYGGIEGDSASVAELCSLMSALSDVPILQNVAVTGSVNQHGQVQAIGGVNEKIEGFFDVCNLLGSTDEQAVIIPASNVKHLMLRHDVIAAVKAGKFNIYSVAHVDDAMEILTSHNMGQLNKNARYPKGSINYKIAEKLKKYSESKAETSHK